MRILVFARNDPDFQAFRAVQFKPEEFYFAADEPTILHLLRDKDTAVIMLPLWLQNPQYSRIVNLRQLITSAQRKW